ncbi:hypothetical protein MMC07_002935 [Pseudocyphellaria aurata]|nr:hypothetical protein [Pseudocyphellaria aurata]
MLCHDGANPADLGEELSPRDDVKMGKLRVEAEEFVRKVMFRGMILSLIKSGYNVALINGLEWMDTKVMSMVVEGSRRAPYPSTMELAHPNTERLQSSILPTMVESFLLKLGFNARAQFSSYRKGSDGQTQEPEDTFSGMIIDDQPVVSECVYLTLTVLAYMLQNDTSKGLLAPSFLIHTVLKGETRISDRPQLWDPEVHIKDIHTSSFLAEFSSLSRSILDDKSWNRVMNNQSIQCDVADLVDGRLFSSVANEFMENSFSNGQVLASLKPKVESLARTLRSLCGIRLEYQDREFSSNVTIKASSREEVSRKSNNISILPFANSVFDKHLASIKISVDSSNFVNQQSARIFQEISHWHNAKRRMDAKTIHPLSEKDKGRVLKRNQFFMAEMQAYAASLTNAAGKILEPKTVTVSDGKKTNKSQIENSKESDDSGSSRKPHNSKSASNRKGAGKKSMLENLKAEQATKANAIVEKSFVAWQNVRKDLDSEPHLSSKYSKTKSYLGGLSGSKSTALQAEVGFYILTILVDIYRNLCNERDEKDISRISELYGIAALIWDSIRKLSVIDGLTKIITDYITQVSRLMGLPAIEPPKPTSDRNLAFTPDSTVLNSGDVSISLKSIDFQCLHCGPYMDRNLDSAPDHRVPFRPDGWQRKVLDELDANRSVFVVAPTSAGKTFISFYAMERTLKASDDSILVYVAPTKALVNQIAAEIQARYKKTYKHAGNSVWAIHTRDYRINNPSGCQILVTVPHILQIMLLSPTNAKSWSEKVKTIIFDEIHSIGNAEDGVVWEQLLLLAPCPIIALSATVGNPEKFSEWLATTQKASGIQLTMIKHKHRYSDLRKFTFVPPKRFAFQGLSAETAFATLGLDSVEGFSFIHPVASLVNKSRGIPDDLSLEARDCLSLWKSMFHHQTSQFPVDISLDPRTSTFPRILAKVDVIKWEESLKQLLKTWMDDDESPFDKVLEDLSKSMAEFRHGRDQISRRHADDTGTDDLKEIDKNDLKDTTLPLLCKLHERDALPAILFNYDRSKCEEICRSVIGQLTLAEQRWKEKSTFWKKQLRDWEQWKKEQTKIAGKKTAKIAPKRRGRDDEEGPSSKADRVQDAANSEASPFANFDPEDPIDGFHFAAKHKIDSAELSRYFSQLKRRGVSPWLTEALTRGIGVHHAGMNRKYRQFVEMLFRRGYLRVVIATGTLALGINMPCATVVFSGDSVFLTALNFRQAAGRAGRRGFDLLGNVVFQNISDSKVCRLISSRLPDLNGHFPITTTLVLRLFTLLHESGNSPYAIRAINSLLSQPRLYLDGSGFKDQVLHHLRFSIEYLRRQSLLSSHGVPLNFAGLTSHLYYTENSCFALNALLKGGYFHELCSGIREKRSSVLRTLMVVMAHLFGRRPCRQVDQEYIDTIVKRSASVVFLPPLPTRAAQILRQHNQDTLHIFTNYVKTFVDQHINSDDCSLPLTGVTVGGQNAIRGPAGMLPPARVRSPFVALSGHGDTFDDISDLCRTTRAGVFLEKAVIPHLDVYPDEEKTPLNAYLYDFYMHGDLGSLERANGVRKSDVWFLLNDFSMVLATIVTSLGNFLKLPDSDLSMLDVMGEGDEHNNLEDDKIAAEIPAEMADGSSSNIASDRGRVPLPTVPKSNPNSKKKIAKSWDDEDLDEVIDLGSAGGRIEGTILGDANSRSIDEIEEGFLNIYLALSNLRAEFDIKFKAIFA